MIPEPEFSRTLRRSKKEVFSMPLIIDPTKYDVILIDTKFRAPYTSCTKMKLLSKTGNIKLSGE